MFFDPSPNSYYQFYEDKDDIPSNNLKKWKGNPRNALEVSVGLITFVDELLSEAVVELEDGSLDIDADKALKSAAYCGYLVVRVGAIASLRRRRR